MSITLLTEVSGPEFQLMHCPSRTLSPAVNENEGTLLARGTAGGSSMGFTTSEEEEESLRHLALRQVCELQGIDSWRHLSGSLTEVIS